MDVVVNSFLGLQLLLSFMVVCARSTGKAIKLHEHWDGSFSMAAYAFPFVTPEEDSATTSAPADEL